MVWRTKVQVRVQGCSFVCFFPLFFFTLVQIMREWKKCYGLKTLLKAHKLPHFRPILELIWLVLWICTRWLLEGVHFQPFQVHTMEVNWKVGQKVEG